MQFDREGRDVQGRTGGMVLNKTQSFNVSWEDLQVWRKWRKISRMPADPDSPENGHSNDV